MKQKSLILTHLKLFKSITSWDAIEKFGITRLSEYIRQLRREDGWIIDDVIETKGDKYWKRYYLIPEKQMINQKNVSAAVNSYLAK